MPQLTSAQKRGLLRNAVLGTALINASINVAVAWISARYKTAVPLWKLTLSATPSTLTDTVGTLFFLPVITTVLFTSAVWRDLRSDRLEPLAPTHLGVMTRLQGGAASSGPGA